MSANASKDFLLFRRLLAEARPYWGHIILIFLVSVLATPLTLLIPLPLKVVVDSVLGDQPLPRFLETITPQFLHESREYRLADLRQQFAIVPQDPALFSRTIAENIAYARPDASEADILTAAKAANAHDFIAHLPEGYATVVGGRGMSLSGGERQRISISRAFPKNALILILDEPTSALDVETESTLMEAMERLMQGRTSLTIAHRLSTVRSCDWRLHFEDGQVEVQRANAQQDEVVPNEALA